MEIDAKITILFGDKGMEIEVKDVVSNTRFLKIRLNSEQTCQALSRLGDTECASAEVRGLENVGKERISKPLVFKVPKSTDSNATELLNSYAHLNAEYGWTPQCYFGSQGSFFEKDGKHFARTVQFKFVEPGSEEVE